MRSALLMITVLVCECFGNGTKITSEASRVLAATTIIFLALDIVEVIRKGGKQ